MHPIYQFVKSRVEKSGEDAMAAQVMPKMSATPMSGALRCHADIAGLLVLTTMMERRSRPEGPVVGHEPREMYFAAEELQWAMPLDTDQLSGADARSRIVT